MASTGVSVDQKETDRFLKNLWRFPHLFQLQGYKDLGRARLESIRDRLRDEKTEIDLQRNSEVGYGKLQRSRDSNVIAFTSFRLDDYDTAKSESERVLQDDPHNIVTLANLAVFAWERGSRVEAEERLQTLKEMSDLPDFDNKRVEAKAELAYCYSRMGPSYTDLAVLQFEEVVELRPLEYDWKIGLGIVLTRAIRPNQRMYHGTGGQAAIHTAHKAVDLFLEVKQSHAADSLKAQAATQLGLLFTKHVGQDYDLQRSIQNYYRLRSVSPQQCFDDALLLAPNDSSTLTKSGQHFYRIGKHQKAKNILERAIAIRRTTIAHHILGLIYYKMVSERYTKMETSERNVKQKQKGRRRKKSGRSAEYPSTTEQSYRGCTCKDSVPCGFPSEDDAMTLHQIPHLQEDAEYIDFDLNSSVEHTAELLSGLSIDEGISQQTSTCNAMALETDTVSADRKKKSRRQRRQKGKRRTPTGGTFTAVGQTEVSSQSVTDISNCRENILETAELPQDIKLLAAESVRQFKLAIELAHDDNDTAHLHLARLYMILGQYRECLDECKKIMGQEKSKNSPSERIHAYELAGQCNLKLSEIEHDCHRKEKLKEEGHKLLKVALSVQCHYAKQVPEYKGYYGKPWQSFHTLMEAIQNDTTSSDGDKQKERAVLLHMIGEYSDSLQIIQDISQYTGDEAIDPNVLEVKLRCYIGLKQYDEAVTFLRNLGMTDQRYFIQNCNELWVQTPILAAREALLFHGDTLARKYALKIGCVENIGAEIAKAYFLLAFNSRFSSNPFLHVGGSNNEFAPTQSDTAWVDREGGFPLHDWHVMILYDSDNPDIVRKAATIKVILKDICGLQVMSIADVHPGAFERMEILNNVEKSLLAIFMVGEEDRPDESFRQMYLEPTMVTLASKYSCLRELFILITDGDRPPPSLNLGSARPCFRCPPVLFGPCGEGPSGDLPSIFGHGPFANAEVSIFTKEKVLATCDLFGAMLGVSIREFPY